MTDGTLRTPGVVDFFRMLNEQVRSAGILQRNNLDPGVYSECFGRVLE
jgi:hypothetical protein